MSQKCVQYYSVLLVLYWQNSALAFFEEQKKCAVSLFNNLNFAFFISLSRLRSFSSIFFSVCVLRILLKFDWARLQRPKTFVFS